MKALNIFLMCSFMLALSGNAYSKEIHHSVSFDEYQFNVESSVLSYSKNLKGEEYKNLVLRIVAKPKYGFIKILKGFKPYKGSFKYVSSRPSKKDFFAYKICSKNTKQCTEVIKNHFSIMEPGTSTGLPYSVSSPVYSVHKGNTQKEFWGPKRIIPEFKDKIHYPLKISMIKRPKYGKIRFKKNKKDERLNSDYRYFYQSISEDSPVGDEFLYQVVDAKGRAISDAIRVKIKKSYYSQSSKKNWESIFSHGKDDHIELLSNNSLIDLVGSIIYEK